MAQSQRQLLAYSLIALGALWFLVSVGALSGAFLGVLIRFWPALLIGVGLDLLLRQRPFLNLPYTVLIVLGLALYALVGAPGSGGRIVQENLREDLGGAQRAEVELKLSSATVTLGDATEGALIEADIKDSAGVNLSVRGNETKRVTLERRRGRTWNGVDFNRHWDLGLSSHIPLDLSIEGASGAADLDLRNLQVADAKLELRSGATTLHLPDRQATQVSLDGGSGSLSVSVPDGANVTLQADLGSGASTFALGKVDYAELEFDSGSGSVTIDVPENANVKLEVDDDASGSLNLPGWLARESGDGDEGVWQTTGFDPDEGQILIRFKDRGSGSVTLK